MRNILCGVTLLALASCAPSVGGSDNEISAADQPGIIDLLKTGDISACAYPDVIATLNGNAMMSFDEARKELGLTQGQYGSVEAPALEIDAITATGAKADIGEVECQALLGKALPVTYTVRPDAGGRGIVVYFDGQFQYLMSINKADHRHLLAMTIPTASPTSADEDASQPSTAPPATEPEPTAFDKAKAALDRPDPADGNQ